MPDDDRPTVPWVALAAKLDDAYALYDRLGGECWSGHDVIAAVRYRGMAEGLDHARTIMRNEIERRPEDGGWTAVLVNTLGRPVDPGDTFAVAAADGIQILIVRRTALAPDGGLAAGYNLDDALLLWEEFDGDDSIPYRLDQARAMAAGLNHAGPTG